MVAPFSVYPKGTVPIRMIPIAKTLIERGNQVSIVVPPYDNISESMKEYSMDGVNIANALFLNFPIVKYPSTLFSMIKKILKLNPEVVYVFKPKGYSGLAATIVALARSFGIFRKTRLLLDTDDWEGRGGFADFFEKNSRYPSVNVKFF